MDNLDKWVEYLNEERRSINTIDSYKRDMVQFLHCINKDITEVNKNDIEGFKSNLMTNGMSIASINRKLVSINQFIKFLNEELALGIMVKIKQEKVQKQEYLENVITREEFDRLIIEAEKVRDYRAIALISSLMYTGMRISELLQLKVSDVGKDKILIKGKGSKYRNVYISNKLQAILKEYLLHRTSRETVSLFTSMTGLVGNITRSTVDRMIKKYAELSGVDVSKAHCHGFRHAYSLSLIERGVSISEVADILGHSSLETTRIYTRKTKDQMMHTINSL